MRFIEYENVITNFSIDKCLGVDREQRLDVFGAALCIIADIVAQLESKRWMNL